MTFHPKGLGKSVLDSHPYTVQCKVLQPMKTYTSHFTDVSAIHRCNSKKYFSKVLLLFFSPPPVLERRGGFPATVGGSYSYKIWAR